MVIVRRRLLFLMVTILLPWGAYGARFAVADPSVLHIGTGTEEGESVASGSVRNSVYQAAGPVPS